MDKAEEATATLARIWPLRAKIIRKYIRPGITLD